MGLSNLLELFILGALWGGSFIFMRIGAPEFGPIPLIELRTSIAAVFLLPLLFEKNKLLALRANWRPIFVVSIINIVIPFPLLAYATLFITASFTAILNATAPMFTAIVAYLWLKDKQLSTTSIIGLLVGFIGVFVLVIDKDSITSSIGFWPVVAALVGTCCYGIAANYIKKNLSAVNPLVIAAGSQVFAAAVLLPLAIFWWPSQNPVISVWFDVIALGVACTGVAFIIYFRLISNVGPARAISVTYLIPIFGLIWGVIFLDELVTINMIVGCVLTLIGIALTSDLLQKKRRKAVIN